MSPILGVRIGHVREGTLHDWIIWSLSVELPVIGRGFTCHRIKRVAKRRCAWIMSERRVYTRGAGG